MTGIYKITSPSGKVYIGQSRAIYKRWSSYKRLQCKTQTKLYNSFKKYGVESHFFLIIHQLPSDISNIILDDYEQSYMDAYRYCGVELLNLREAGSHGTHSLETRILIGEKGKGRIMSEETRRKQSERLKGHTFNIGKKFSIEHKEKISLAHKGKTHSIEHRINNSISKSGEKHYCYGIDPAKHPKAKKIKSQNTNIVYDTLCEAAKEYGIKRTTLCMMLTGRNKNKTDLVYDI